jgi:GTPase SAR1 family protein
MAPIRISIIGIDGSGKSTTTLRAIHSLSQQFSICKTGRRKLGSGISNPSVSGVFIPLWQRGIKGDFKIMLVKSPLAPLFQRGV